MPLSDIRHHFSVCGNRCPGNAEECGSHARAVVQQEGAPGSSRGRTAGPHPHAHGLGPQQHLCLEGSAQVGWDGPDP